VRRYRFYVDESGDHGYSNLDDDLGGRYLALTGLMIESEVYRTQFHPTLNQLKQDHIPHDPDNPVILHRRDIIDRTGPFKVLQDATRREKFNDAIIEFAGKRLYRMIAVVLDKKSHLDKYGAAAFHPYHYCLAALLERYCGLLAHQGAMGDVLAETRGKKEDAELKRAYSQLLLYGTQFRSGSFFKNVLISDELKTATKKANIAGLQFADLVTYPSKQDVLTEFGRIQAPQGDFRERLRKAMRGRYNRRFSDGRIKGYGMVLL